LAKGLKKGVPGFNRQPPAGLTFTLWKNT